MTFIGSNQLSSGRCWLFACLNAIRIPFIRFHKLEEFEFSQSYLFFWDKVERCNYFLDVFEEVARKKEAVDGRLMMFLLSNPVNDGGQWDMLVNLIKKYGLIPKKCWKESSCSEASRDFNRILNYKLRECAYRIRTLVLDTNANKEELQKEKDTMMKEIFGVCCICLGSPPSSFTWEYYDKLKQFNTVSDISPQLFYQKYVKPVFNMDDKICLVNDPRNPYGQLYTVEYLNNMSNGRITLYNNQPMDVIKKLASTAIRDGEPVWFGCDVGKHFVRKLGLLDLKCHQHDLVFGFSSLNLDKKSRLLYGESLMTHAMLLTGVSFEMKDGTNLNEIERRSEWQPSKWRVENSWGDSSGEKGYLVMTDDWFSEFVFEVVVDKKHIPKDILTILEQKPIVLPAWDPMGALA
ncbi:Bleomycin hydrolase [Trichoplax sp. H2]|nr:Bleomycin hydrolase [Trichoplax sp. H2]|eukprot:RDD40032.1 Bleomycin hydrolase [Trichoplax sp. H2]